MVNLRKHCVELEAAKVPKSGENREQETKIAYTIGNKCLFTRFCVSKAWSP